jgi:hypothetical protein
MNAGARAVPFDAAISGRACQILPARFLDDRFVQRLALPLVIFTEVNPDHPGGPIQDHDALSVGAIGCSSRCVYLMTSTSESTTRPSSTICSRIGRYARIFASSSTTDRMIG